MHSNTHTPTVLAGVLPLNRHTHTQTLSDARTRAQGLNKQKLTRGAKAATSRACFVFPFGELCRWSGDIFRQLDDVVHMTQTQYNPKPPVVGLELRPLA